jgi:hypothetical protein
MPKYYVGFGKDFKLVATAKTPQDACLKTLRRFLEKDAQDPLSNVADTINTPDKFRVSEKGFPAFNHVNDEDYHEFSYGQISKMLGDKGSGGELAYA